MPHAIKKVLRSVIYRIPGARRPFQHRDAAFAERDAALRQRDAAQAQLARLQDEADARHDIPDVLRLSREDWEVKARLSSLAEWENFIRARPEAASQTVPEEIARHAAAHGIVSAFFGNIWLRIAENLATLPADKNYRENLIARGLNARQRALLDLLSEVFEHQAANGLRIYAHEALTLLAMTLRARYPRFVGSEYAGDDAGRDWLFPIPALDAAATGWPDAGFDAVLSADVLEHVPDIGATLRETARILKPGGHFLATFPFACNAEQTSVRARLENGAITYFSPPEYHGNPVDPEGGSLVFAIPGWDIIGQCEAAGFRRAEMLFWMSARHGITGGPGVGGVFILDALK